MDNKELEAIEHIGGALHRVAEAITAPAVPGPDATGGVVASLTEAVMGMTAGLCRIADAIDGLADAVREKGEK